MEHKVIYHVATDSLKDFEECAGQVKELGGTHMMVGDLPRSRWMWERDLKDPYSNWSMGMPSCSSWCARRSLSNICLRSISQNAWSWCRPAAIS